MDTGLRRCDDFFVTGQARWGAHAAPHTVRHTGAGRCPDSL